MQSNQHYYLLFVIHCIHFL